MPGDEAVPEAGVADTLRVVSVPGEGCDVVAVCRASRASSSLIVSRVMYRSPDDLESLDVT